MADPDRGTFETVLGAIMVQHALCEFLLSKGVIERQPLLEFLAAKQIAWESTVPANALFPLQMIATMLAGKPMPAPPASMH